MSGKGLFHSGPNARGCLRAIQLKPRDEWIKGARVRDLSSYCHAIPACLERSVFNNRKGSPEPTYNSPAIRLVD